MQFANIGHVNSRLTQAGVQPKNTTKSTVAKLHEFEPYVLLSDRLKTFPNTDIGHT